MKTEDIGLVPIEINLAAAEKGDLSEDYLGQFGAIMKLLMSSVMNGYNTPFRIRGSKSSLSKFAKVVGSEKRYMETFNKYGLNHKTTYASKYKLDKAVRDFERSTGLKWPFK